MTFVLCNFPIAGLVKVFLRLGKPCLRLWPSRQYLNTSTTLNPNPKSKNITLNICHPNSLLTISILCMAQFLYNKEVLDGNAEEKGKLRCSLLKRGSEKSL